VGSAETARVIGAAAFAALFFAPHAANHSLEATSVETSVVGLPVELGFYPGASRVDGLNQATVYLDKTVANIGIDAKITGLPRIENIRQATTLISPERLSVYTSLADSPDEALEGYATQMKSEAIDNAYDFELGHALPYGLALYGGLGMLRLRRKLGEARGERTGPELTPLYATGLATMALAGSLTVADYHHEQWLQSGGIPEDLSTIEALDGTSLQGAKIDNPGLEPTLNTAIRYGLRLKERRLSERDSFLEKAVPNLTAQLETLSAPRDDERLLIYISDMHAGKAGIRLATTLVEVLQDRFGVDKVKHMFNLGDTLYDPGLQGATLGDQAGIMQEGSQVLTPGNHDVGKTKSLAADAGIIVPKGRETIDGIDMYSVADPEQTPFLQDSYYPDPTVTQESIGLDALASIQESPVDVVNFHDPAAVAALVGATSRGELTAEGELTTCEGNDDFEDINADLVSAGHSHKQYPINMDCNSDGTWFVVNLQGTGGGAEESPTFNNWSDPDGVPIKTVSFRVFYQNTTYDSMTGFADVEVSPDTVVKPVVRTNIGSVDGAPFITDDSGDTAIATPKKEPTVR
jgi:hypothetical protein